MRQQRLSGLLVVLFLLSAGGHATVWATAPASTSLDAAPAPTFKPDNSHFDLAYEPVSKVLKALHKDTDILKYQAKIIITPLNSRHVVYVLDHMNEEFLPGITMLYDPNAKRILGAFVRDATAVTSKKALRLFNEMLATESLGALDDYKALQIALFYLAFSGQSTELVTTPSKLGPQVAYGEKGYVISITTKSARGPQRWRILVRRMGCLKSIRSL